MRSSWLVLSLLIATGCSSDATKSVGASTIPAGATTTTAGSGTTTSAEVATTPVPTTVAPEGGYGEPVPADSGPSAWDTGANSSDSVVATVGDCAPLHDRVLLGLAPTGVQRCGVWNAVGGQRMWTVDEVSSGHLVAIVWQQSAPNSAGHRRSARERGRGVLDRRLRRR